MLNHCFRFRHPLLPYHSCRLHQGSATNAPPVTEGAEAGPSTSAPSPASGDATKAEEEAPTGDVEAGAEEAALTPMEVDKVKPEEESKSQTPVPTKPSTPQPQTQQPQQQQQQTGQTQGPASQQSSKDAVPQIDLFLEASKLPLDVAIFNCTRAAGGDDKIRKYLQAVLVVGGTAQTPGMAHALESRYVFVRLSILTFFFLSLSRFSARKIVMCRDDKVYFALPPFSALFSLRNCVFRGIFLGMVLMIDLWATGRLQAIATPLVQGMEKVQIIPPPKDVDKRVLTWKGASVLGRMEGVTDMWVTGTDWVRQVS